MALIKLQADARDRLRVYLNDHLAGATAGRDLAERCRASNCGSQLGDFLGGLAAQIEEDRATLERLILALRMPIAKPKLLLAAVGERLGRLKMNGQLFGYSDLARLIELEALCIGVEGKGSLWRNLEQIADPPPAIRNLPLDDLISRAARQRSDLEEHRRRAARRAFDLG